MNTINIIGKKIGDGRPLYFIADIGANHDGSLERAFKLIELAKNAGADAAKFQNFQAHKIVSDMGFKQLGKQAAHQAKWDKPVYEVYKDASVSFEWTAKLKSKCNEVGIEYFTSPYDFESVDMVDPFVNVHKIGSGDITWIEIIEYIAKKNKPVLIATGASSMEDVERAMKTLQSLTNNIVLMQCNTNYTGDISNFKFQNLNVLKTFAAAFPNVVLGLSDHTPGHSTVLGAVALGATVFEKHFTDDNNRKGPDHNFAMNPVTWREMVDRSNELYLALGDGIKRIEENEKASLVVQRRSLRANRDLVPGDIIEKTDVDALRPIPENGFPPYVIEDIIGKKISNKIMAGEHFTNENVIV